MFSFITKRKASKETIRAENLYRAIVQNTEKGYVQMVYHYNMTFDDETEIKAVLATVNDLLNADDSDIRVFLHNSRITTSTRTRVNTTKLHTLLRAAKAEAQMTSLSMKRQGGVFDTLKRSVKRSRSLEDINWNQL